MNILLVLIPVSLVLLLLAIATFAWAVRRGQFEDLDTAAIDILREERNSETAPGAAQPPVAKADHPHAD